MANKHVSNRKGLATWRWLLLLLVAWPGPRPIVHSHEQIVGRAASAAFGTHLAIFHSDESRQIAPSKLHLHWGYAECNLTDPTAAIGEVTAQTDGPSDGSFTADELTLESWCEDGESFVVQPQWLAIDKRTATPTGRLWLQLCAAWTC